MVVPRAVCKSEAWRKVVLIRVVELARRFDSRTSQTTVLSEDEGCDLVFLLFQHPKVFISKTESQREIWSRFPLILKEETITVRAEVTLCVCWSTRLRVSIDLVEERRIVGKVEETTESKEG